jgi:hypothetical protein
MLEQIKKTNGRIFSVTFVKKDGTIRKMTARLGVKKDLKGVGLKFNPSERSLVVVFDMHKRAYRMINLQTIITFKHESKRTQGIQQA